MGKLNEIMDRIGSELRNIFGEVSFQTKDGEDEKVVFYDKERVVVYTQLDMKRNIGRFPEGDKRIANEILGDGIECISIETRNPKSVKEGIGYHLTVWRKNEND